MAKNVFIAIKSGLDRAVEPIKSVTNLNKKTNKKRTKQTVALIAMLSLNLEL